MTTPNEVSQIKNTPMVHQCCGREHCDDNACPNNGPWYKVPKWRMDAYYYGFEPTGVSCIDRILSAVACAGKSFHSTQDWPEAIEHLPKHLRGGSVVECIQNAAIDAAAEVQSRASATREAARVPPNKTFVQERAYTLDDISEACLSADLPDSRFESIAIAIALAAIAQPVLPAPIPGWQLVPICLTPYMRVPLLNADIRSTKETYAMLLAAAPEPPVQPSQAQGLSKSEVDDLVYACRAAGDDSTYALSAAIIAAINTKEVI